MGYGYFTGIQFDGPADFSFGEIGNGDDMICPLRRLYRKKTQERSFPARHGLFHRYIVEIRNRDHRGTGSNQRADISQRMDNIDVVFCEEPGQSHLLKKIAIGPAGSPHRAEDPHEVHRSRKGPAFALTVHKNDIFIPPVYFGQPMQQSGGIGLSPSNHTGKQVQQIDPDLHPYSSDSLGLFSMLW
jgi:hypothetical protein